jgi:hypothetical protein
MTRWEVLVIWWLRAAVLVTGVVFLERGEWIMGAFCAIAVGVSIVPTLVVRTPNLTWPVEVEVALLWLLMCHLMLGILLDLYNRIVWFDKVLHLGDSVVIGFVAFMAVYAAHVVRGGRRHPVLDGVAILIATLGLGALWEIGEFAADQLFGRHTQGSPTMSPLVDTMWDLILDGSGGVIAAILGALYIHRSRRSRERCAHFAAHLASQNAGPGHGRAGGLSPAR